MWTAVILAVQLTATSHPCADASRFRRSYVAGHASGRATTILAWRDFRCDNEELLQETMVRIVDRATLPEDPGTYAECRYSGFVDGIMQSLGDLSMYCMNACFANGETVGRIAAEAWCELGASGLKYIRGPVATCGLAYEMACDVVFADTTAECVGVGRAEWRWFRARHCAYAAPWGL